MSTTEDRAALKEEYGSHRRRPSHPIRRRREHTTHSLQDHAQSRSAEIRQIFKARALFFKARALWKRDNCHYGTFFW